MINRVPEIENHAIDDILFEHNVIGYPMKHHRRLEAWVTWVGHIRAAGEMVSNRTHFEDLLFYCIDGGGEYELGKVSGTIEPGTILLLPHGIPHSLRNTTPPWEVMYLHMGGSYAEVLARDIGFTRKHPAHHIGVLPAVIERFKSLLKVVTDKAFGYEYDAMLGLIAYLIEIRKNYMDRIFTHSAMLDSISWQTESVGDLADEAGCTKHHFIRNFKKATGMTPWSYVLHLKVNRSIELLRNSRLSIKEIAHMVGIEDPAYFSRLFKKRMGIAPKQYRVTLLIR